MRLLGQTVSQNDERSFRAPSRLTRVGQALARRLGALEEPIVTDYALFLELRRLYRSGRGLYLRSDIPTLADHRRTRSLLIQERIIARDFEYNSVYRIISKQDLPADEITCLIDPFCYISHISAMQRYGLTDRRPEALHLTVPGPRIVPGFIEQKMTEDYGEEMEKLEPEQVRRLTVVHHPERVRRRKIDVLATVHYGTWVRVRGSFARLATVGQTFLDMLEEPARCGGMVHVIETWQEHARIYLGEIIAAVDGASKSVHKVRAGYILAELMGIDDRRIMAWKMFAQRGGSRLLDPGSPFMNKHSEEWMLSINV